MNYATEIPYIRWYKVIIRYTAMSETMLGDEGFEILHQALKHLVWKVNFRCMATLAFYEFQVQFGACTTNQRCRWSRGKHLCDTFFWCPRSSQDRLWLKTTDLIFEVLRTCPLGLHGWYVWVWGMGVRKRLIKVGWISVWSLLRSSHASVPKLLQSVSAAHSSQKTTCWWKSCGIKYSKIL